MKKDLLNRRATAMTIVLNDNGADLFKNARHIVTTFRCNEQLCIPFIACIKHDRDVDKETDHVKTTHYHLVIQFDRGYRLQTILNLIVDMFHCNANQVTIDKCTSIEMQTRYLIHLDDFDKQRYDESEVVTNDSNILQKYFEFIKHIKTADDLIAIVHEYPRLDILISHIGIDNYKKYRNVIQDLRRENTRY